MTKPILIYFHGSPGSRKELDLIQGTAWRAYVEIFIPEPTEVPPSTATAFEHIASEIKAKYPHTKVHLVGFSLGSFVALQIAHLLGNKVESIDLISASAPLEFGNFLPNMAGRPVFELAKKSQISLKCLIKVQAILAKHFPAQLHKMLFSTATGADKALSEDTEFQAIITGILRDSFNENPKPYLQNILAYVRPWGEIVKDIHAPTTLWHGSEDNWAPYEMAEALQNTLPNAEKIEKLLGHSHYSSLIEALPKIVTRITK